MGDNKLQFYEVKPEYIDYLSKYAPHLFMNSKENQKYSRKFVGIVLKVDKYNYFAPLSSMKEKHIRMKERLDLIKIKNYAVINLNNMFPVPEGVYVKVDFSMVKDRKYKDLLIAEYRFIKSIKDKIVKYAYTLYMYKLRYKNTTPLAKRCNDFSLLEIACDKYKS